MKNRKLVKFSALGGIAQKVVQDDGVIKGVRLCTAGEAKGHGVFLEETFIDEVVALANKGQKSGVKCRFGHPTMCSEALGTYLGVFKNVAKGIVQYPDPEDPEKTIDAPCAFGDLYLSNSAKLTPNGDLYSYVLAAAAEHPDKFATSIVFEIGDFYTYDASGARIVWSPEGSAQYDAALEQTGREFVTCATLFGCDVVDEPAANEGGLFSAFSKETLAGQVTGFLDDNPKVLELLEKSPETVSGFLSRYNDYLRAQGKPEVKLGQFHDIEESLAAAISGREAAEAALAAATARIPELEAAANSSLEETMRLKDENASLSAERDALKARTEHLEKRISVELSGSEPGKFGKGSDAETGHGSTLELANAKANGVISEAAALMKKHRSNPKQ